MKRRQEQSSRGRGRNYRGRGNFQGRGQNQEDHKEIKQETSQSEGNVRGNFRGRRDNSRGGFGGIRASSIVCFNCNKEGHYASRCPDRASSSSQGERRTHLVQDDEYQEKEMADSDRKRRKFNDEKNTFESAYYHGTATKENYL